MKRENLKFLVGMLLGISCFLLAGLVFRGTGMEAWFGLCIGIGAAALALCIGETIRVVVQPASQRAEIDRKKEIEVNDERNVRIREKTGSMVAKTMIYVLSAFIIVLAVLQVDVVIILLAVGLLAVELILFVSFANYYSKKCESF